MANGLPAWVPQEEIPPWVLQRMEAARDPAMGQVAQAAPRMQKMSDLEPLKPLPAVPTVADLYPDPGMATSFLRFKNIDPSQWHPSRVPLQGDDLRRYYERRREETSQWQTQRQAAGEERMVRSQEETARAARAREAAAAARQAALDEREARKVREAETADRLRLEGSIEQSNLAINAARKALSDVGILTSGLVGGLTKWIPGSPALDLDQALEPVRAITSFEQLNRMKEASRTGGALGQIAVRELDLLGASVASLNTSQGPDQLRENLRRVIQHFKAWQEKVQKAWEVEGAPSADKEKPGVPGVRAKTFATEQEAEAAAKRGDIKPGDKITVDGRRGTWR